ncbi:hypothetical protein RMCBS344292_16751 [Rhizopus microsporus]|nr:hypothetical protein RMCBS344292_16751 [Rhizopus microsporus]
MLNQGRWESDDYTLWKPAECKVKSYTTEELYSCLSNSRIIYIGDSIMREQYYAMAEMFRPGRPEQDAIHADQAVYLEEHNVTIEMWWDPFLNTNRTLDVLQGKQKLQHTLLILDTGVWYMKDYSTNYLREWKKAVDRVFDAVQNHQIADKVMLSPVEVLEYDRLSEERRKVMTPGKVKVMNNYLRERERMLEDTVTPLAIPFVWNEISASSKNKTLDGLHFQPPVTTTQARIALNYYCNNKLPLKFSTEATCCHHSSYPVWYLAAVALSLLCLIAVFILMTFGYRANIIDTLCAVKIQLKTQC